MGKLGLGPVKGMESIKDTLRGRVKVRIATASGQYCTVFRGLGDARSTAFVMLAAAMRTARLQRLRFQCIRLAKSCTKLRHYVTSPGCVNR